MKPNKSFLSQPPARGAVQEPGPGPGEAPAPAQDLRHRLELPPNHSLYKLWALCSGLSGRLPAPELCLEGPAAPPLPEEQAKLELVRLKIAVNRSANERMDRLRAGTTPDPQEEGAVILPDMDAECMVHLAKDGLTAWVLLYPPIGQGQPAGQAQLKAALDEAGVCFGLEEAALARLGQNPRYFRLVRAARGKPPARGADGRAEELFARTLEPPAWDEEAEEQAQQLDYKSLGRAQAIQKGGVICRLLPPAPGVPGRSVQGQELPAEQGSPAALPKGRNTELSGDGAELLASIDGQVEFSGRSFQVRPVLEIPGDVDESVGSISFLGNVHIGGNVCSGFSVRATGTITVDGVIQNCSVEAGRDLIVARGIQGDGEAIVRAQRSMFAKFIENSRIYAKQGLVADCIINSDVYCDGSVIVQSGHKSIIGGKICAAREVRAGVLGNRVEGRTVVALGGQPCEEFDYDLLALEIENGEKELASTEAQPESPDRAARLAGLQTQLARDRARLLMVQKERRQQREEAPAEGQEGRRLQCEMVYPGALLTIGRLSHRFTKKTAPCRAAVVDGEIHIY